LLYSEGAIEHRIDYLKVAPEALRGLRELDAYVRHSGLDPSLIELIKVRASQVNGCAFCIDMHTLECRCPD